MQITEVRIKLVEGETRNRNERLHAFGSITFDDIFVVRDLKIIEGSKGLFVAMPSRKLTDRCGCGTKNSLIGRYCTNCGRYLGKDRAIRDADGRAKLYADIAHPINSACRNMIQSAVLKEYFEEKERVKQPGYVSNYDDWDTIPTEEGGHDNVIGRLDTVGASKSPHSAPSVRHHRPVSTPGRPAPVTANRPNSFGSGIL